nr:hypothetical protein [Tanacetum cinerariifolium]
MHIEKNVLESILNTLLMNDKSKDTPRQDKTWKCWAFEVACGSAKTKTRSSRSLRLRILSHQRTEKSFVNSSKELNYQMDLDPTSTQSKVNDNLCNLELIYPPAFFDIMIHLVIHLPLEAIFGGHVFKSLCKSISLRSVIRIDHQELKKVIWYVLHNSPEIDTYRDKFKSEYSNKDMKEEFSGWFGKQIRQHHVDNDPGVSESSELFALACRPSQTPISVNSCVVNGVRFVMHSRDERHTTQNNGICSPGPDEEMYYGQLQQILEFSHLNNITQIKANCEAFKNDQYILATQVKQCFYLEDIARRPLDWKVVEHVSHKKFSNGGVIVVEENPDIIHVDNSSDLALSTSLNDLEITALRIDGQSIDVDAPPDIINVVDEDDDIIDEEDPVPHDLADSDDEDLVNLDIDDGVNVVYSSEEED